MGHCPVCKRSANQTQAGPDLQRVECTRCGKYEISGTALKMLSDRLRGDDKRPQARLSHAIRGMGTGSEMEWPLLTSDNLDGLLNRSLPSVHVQMTNLVAWLAAQLGDDHLGIVELPDESDLTAIIGTIDGERVAELVTRAEQEGLVVDIPENCLRISTAGWRRLEVKGADTLAEPPATKGTTMTDSNPTPSAEAGKIFIAMPMAGDNDSYVDVHETIKLACTEAGYDAVRVDEVRSNNPITVEMLRMIREAEYVICDLTDKRPNVFYEAGYALGIGKTPIYVARKGTGLEFDLKDYPVIFFGPLKELREGITARLDGLSAERSAS